MFGTLKSTKSGKDPYLIEVTRPPFEIHEVGKHQINACTSCREKKLKCTGEKAGCRRCSTKGTKCVYIQPGSSKEGRSRKASSAAASDHPSQSNQRPSQDGYIREKPITLDAQSQYFVPRSFQGNGFSFKNTQQPTVSSYSAEERSHPNALQGKCTSNLSTSLETVNALPGSLENDLFDFDDLNGSQAYNSFALPFDFDEAVSHDQFDTTEMLQDSIWSDDDSHTLSNKEMDATQGSFLDSPQPIQSRNPRSFSSLAEPPASNTGNRPYGSSVTITANIQPEVAGGDSTALGKAIESCQCVQIALKIDEQLKIYTAVKGSCRSITGSGTVRKLDEDLNHLKRVLAQCSAMLDCRFCSGESSIIMLIISISEKLLASFEQLCNSFLVTTSPDSRRSPSSESRRSTNTIPSVFTDDSQGMKMGDYTLDTEDEIQVVRALVISRMKNLGSLLSRLENIISSNRWTGHGEILESIHQSYRRTATKIKRLEVQQ